MKIRKIYLQNFKGIYEKKIINFDNHVSLLVGPNGFGKTTIFDVLELCLTGKIYRTSQKDNVTKHQKDYNKPFYQNTPGQDVLVKVWLSKFEDGNEEHFVITRHLPKNHDGRSDGVGRRNKPNDFDLLDTYSENIEHFDKEEFDISKMRPIDQNDINQFFGFEEDSFDIKDIYNLFNYLQQEETTFFLKKSENDRKDSLGFLFQTTKQEEEYDKLTKMQIQLKGINKKLKVKISEINNLNKLEGLKYESLFPYKELDFDKKDLFDKLSLDVSRSKLKTYFSELDDIISFLINFSITDYKNRLIVEELTRKTNDIDFLNYFTLSNLIEKKYQSINEKIDLMNNDELLSGFILKNCINNYKDYKNINSNIHKFNEFLTLDNLDNQLNSLLSFVTDIIPEGLERFKMLYENRKYALETAKSIDLSLKEIIRSRNNLYKEIKKTSRDTLDNEICPYCGEDWGSHELLLDGFREREETFRNILTKQTNQLATIEEELENDYIEPIQNYMNEYLKKHPKVDSKILNILEELSNIEFDFVELENYNFNSSLHWSSPKTYQDLQEDLKEVKKVIDSKIPVTKEIYSMIQKISSISFESSIEDIQEIIPAEYLKTFIISTEHEKIATTNQSKIRMDLIKFINEYKENFKYDHNKAKDDKDIYSRYFDNDENIFNKLSVQKLNEKKQYINYVYSIKESHILDMYKERERKLEAILKKIEKTRESYNKLIVKHKKRMVENIKLPFYIYTAKILQNYQQGMGVFLSTNENDAIRFLTDSTSDHDAIHHLSSGQLAVVSLAFTLAINKTYNISNNLKFLAIDDPIQEMDALNVHSFIELIRHEFLKDYQLIFSTHSDSSSLYMKYKFEKFTNQNVSLISVQNEFFD